MKDNGHWLIHPEIGCDIRNCNEKTYVIKGSFAFCKSCYNRLRSLKEQGFFDKEAKK